MSKNEERTYKIHGIQLNQGPTLQFIAINTFIKKEEKWARGWIK